MKFRSLWLFYRERFVSLFFNIAALGIILSGIIIGLRQPTYTETVTLHYNRFYGIDQIGSWIWIWIYWLGIIAIAIINFGLSYKVYTRDKYLGYYAQAAAAICSIGFLLYILLLGPYL